MTVTYYTSGLANFVSIKCHSYNRKWQNIPGASWHLHKLALQPNRCPHSWNVCPIRPHFLGSHSDPPPSGKDTKDFLDKLWGFLHRADMDSPKPPRESLFHASFPAGSLSGAQRRRSYTRLSSVCCVSSIEINWLRPDFIVSTASCLSTLPPPSLPQTCWVTVTTTNWSACSHIHPSR